MKQQQHAHQPGHESVAFHDKHQASFAGRADVMERSEDDTVRRNSAQGNPAINVTVKLQTRMLPAVFLYYPQKSHQTHVALSGCVVLYEIFLNDKLEKKTRSL